MEFKQLIAYDGNIYLRRKPVSSVQMETTGDHLFETSWVLECQVNKYVGKLKF